MIVEAVRGRCQEMESMAMKHDSESCGVLTMYVREVHI